MVTVFEGRSEPPVHTAVELGIEDGDQVWSRRSGCAVWENQSGASGSAAEKRSSGWSKVMHGEEAALGLGGCQQIRCYVYGEVCDADRRTKKVVGVDRSDVGWMDGALGLRGC